MDGLQHCHSFSFPDRLPFVVLTLLQYSTVQHNAVQYNTVQNNTTQYNHSLLILKKEIRLSTFDK